MSLSTFATPGHDHFINDTNNWQPRVGGVWDVRGNARDVIRAGWGIYTDFGYTNSNALFPAADASGVGSPASALPSSPCATTWITM